MCAAMYKCIFLRVSVCVFARIYLCAHVHVYVCIMYIDGRMNRLLYGWIIGLTDGWIDG